MRCARGLQQAKVVRPDGIIPFGNTRRFDAWTVPVSNLGDLDRLICDLIEAPRLAIVRGELVNGSPASNIRRLAYPDPEEGDDATLRDVPRWWLALDVENVARPQCVNVTDLEACGRAAGIVQATTSHGIKPDLRLRLWFWLSRPIIGREAARWLQGTPADPSIFRPAQIINTAAPTFEGCIDHLPTRLARLDGTPSVTVPAPAALAPPPAPEATPIRVEDGRGASRYAVAALNNAVTRVAGTVTGSRNATLFSETFGLCRFIGQRLLSPEQIASAMASAGIAAGLDQREVAATLTSAMRSFSR
jgi:hypothetical protein